MHAFLSFSSVSSQVACNAVSHRSFLFFCYPGDTSTSSTKRAKLTGTTTRCACCGNCAEPYGQAMSGWKGVVATPIRRPISFLLTSGQACARKRAVWCRFPNRGHNIFRAVFPAKAPARSRTRLNEAGSSIAEQQGKRYSQPFSLKT